MSNRKLSTKDDTFKLKRQAEEAQYAQQKEQEQLRALSRTASEKAAAQRKEAEAEAAKPETQPMDREFEGGYGGQEDLEDRYATTSGEH